jgi:hypothetical protein
MTDLLPLEETGSGFGARLGVVSAFGCDGECVADVDQVVGDDTEADPALDAGQAFVAAAVQAVASLQKADAAFTAGAPLLGVAEPTLLLEPIALRALG